MRVTVVSATTGSELLRLSIEETWKVAELRGAVASELKTSMKLLVLLLDGNCLEDSQFLRDLREGDEMELQVIRKAWTLRILDQRTVDKKDLHLNVDPDWTVLALQVAVARELSLETAQRPILARHGHEVLDLLDKEQTLEQAGLDPDSIVLLQRVEDAPLSQVEFVSPPGGENFNQRRSEYLESNVALSLIDECQVGQLLGCAGFSVEVYEANYNPETDGEEGAPSYSSSCRRAVGRGQVRSLGKRLFRLPPALTDMECDTIAHEAVGLSFGPQAQTCLKGTRRYERLVVRDRLLRDVLWHRLRSSVEEALAQEEALCPRGFGCAGDWELAGFNECFRVNSYGSKGFLKPHRDAPFSPNVHQRSLCSLLIPMFSTGSTRFYHGEEGFDFRGMSLEEEVEARGGWSSFRTTDVALEAGMPLLFYQDIIHEGLPDPLGQLKMVLRTDLMVQRRVVQPPEPPRSFLTEEERHDQTKALGFFRQAQQKDLAQQPSNELYERALSYRYFHPKPGAMVLPTTPRQRVQPWTAQGKAPVAQAPLLEAFPFHVPEVAYLKGPVAAFRLKAAKEDAAETGTHRTEGHLRMAAIYALHLLGHRAYEEEESNVYTVDFDPATQTVKAISLESLLKAAFDAKPCHGAIYNVVGRNDGDVARDFENAVDRTHLNLQQGCNYMGMDVLAGLQGEAFVQDCNDGYDDYQTEYCNLRGDGIVEPYDVEHPEERVRRVLSLEVQEPRDWRHYLSKQLSSTRWPGLDVLAVAKGEERYLCEEWHSYDMVEPDCSDKVHSRARAMNHLVFDFHEHQLLVEEHERVPSTSPTDPTMFDPLFLWAELHRHRQGYSSDDTVTTMSLRCHPAGRATEETVELTRDSPETCVISLHTTVASWPIKEIAWDPTSRVLKWPGREVLLKEEVKEMQSFLDNTFHDFPWYSISLQNLDASFHHAGECCGSSRVLHVQVQHASYVTSDHTNTVLAVVSRDPSGEPMIWTIYHGLSAL